MITEDEYLALAKANYKKLEALKEKKTFYDHEEAFDQIWRELGQQILEKTISRPPGDRRKKNSHYPVWSHSHCAQSPL